MRRTIYPIGLSNRLLELKIEQNKPFIAFRPGIGGDSMVPYFINKLRKLPPDEYIHTLQNNAGIYFRTKNIKHIKDVRDLKLYCNTFYKCISNSTFISCFPNIPELLPIYTHKPSAIKLHNRVLEPFYFNKSNTWLNKLNNKKVLLISPFAKDMIAQSKHLDTIWSNSNFKMPSNVKWIPFSMPMTLAGNKIHESWKETYEVITNEIKDIEFDVALLSCGGYGAPLCNFIYEELNKTAIYIGGGLQILFGIRGKRWDNRDDLKPLFNEHWIYPSKEPNNNHLVENGCYWK